MKPFCGFDSEFRHDPTKLNKAQKALSIQFAFDNEEHIVRSRDELECLAPELPKNWFSFNLLAEIGALDMLGYERIDVETIRELLRSEEYTTANRKQKKWMREQVIGDYTLWTCGSQQRATLALDGKKFRLFDIMGICRQLGLYNLEKVGDFLAHEKVVTHSKLPDATACAYCPNYPCAIDETRWTCEKYAMHDAIIVERLISHLSKNFDCDLTRIASMGGIASDYLHMERRNKYDKTMKHGCVPPEEMLIRRSLYAGRNECFANGYVGYSYYNDVVSLYPTSTLISDALSITGIEECTLSELEISRDISNRNYGWINGTFRVKSGNWGLPYRSDGRNYYICDSKVDGIYNTMDLAACGASVITAHTCWKPVFTDDKKMIKKYEELYWKKNRKEYKSETQKLLYKGILNSATGKCGQGASQRSFISRCTNFPAYSALLASSHLMMANIMRDTRCELYGMDTDSLMCDQDLTGEYGEAYGIQVAMDLKNKGELAYIRSKMYVWTDGSERPAVHAWHYKMDDLKRIVQATLDDGIKARRVSQQVRVTPNTRTEELKGIPMGMWFNLDVTLDKNKQVQLCIADVKRVRDNYDSLGLIAEHDYCTSEPHTVLSIPKVLRSTELLKAFGVQPIEEGDNSKALPHRWMAYRFK